MAARLKPKGAFLIYLLFTFIIICFILNQKVKVTPFIGSSFNLMMVVSSSLSFPQSLLAIRSNVLIFL
jgi:hypothetical protein